MSVSVNFRTSFIGGFRREDVVAYIEKLSTEHRRETEEFQTRLDDLNAAFKSERETQNDAERQRLFAELEAARNELITKRAECEQLASALRETRESYEQLKLSAGDIDRRSDELEKTKARITEIEISAAERAQRIEDDARHNAERVADHLRRAYDGARTSVERTRSDAGSAVHAIHEELDRLRPALDSLLSRLDEICVQTGEMNIEQDG